MPENDIGFILRIHESALDLRKKVREKEEATEKRRLEQDPANLLEKVIDSRIDAKRKDAGVPEDPDDSMGDATKEAPSVMSQLWPAYLCAFVDFLGLTIATLVMALDHDGERTLVSFKAMQMVLL